MSYCGFNVWSESSNRANGIEPHIEIVASRKAGGMMNTSVMKRFVRCDEERI